MSRLTLYRDSFHALDLARRNAPSQPRSPSRSEERSRSCVSRPGIYKRCSDYYSFFREQREQKRGDEQVTRFRQRCCERAPPYRRPADPSSLFFERCCISSPFPSLLRTSARIILPALFHVGTSVNNPCRQPAQRRNARSRVRSLETRKRQDLAKFAKFVAPNSRSFIVFPRF